MHTQKIIQHISNWLKDYLLKSNTKGFVIGISGGIDSAVTSTIAAKTNKPVLCLEMPILQKKEELQRSQNHIKWLKKKYKNITSERIDLTSTYNDIINKFNKKNILANVNTRARIRMTTLYYLAQSNNYLVLGTGNKVEDFGIGFYTKYGDGGVDISPIADLLKTEVYKIGDELNIIQDIMNAPPTDGLWDDGKTDEDQIGATYEELEWAMNYNGDVKKLDERGKEILNIYKNFNLANQHKMIEIPVCLIPENLK